MRGAVIVVALVVLAGCGAGRGASPTSTSLRAPTSTTAQERATVTTANTTTTTFAGPSPDDLAQEVLDASMDAARFYANLPPDYRRITPAALQDRVAAAHFGAIGAASPDLVGYSIETPRRIVFVVQVEPGGTWRCVGIDDNETGTASRVFGQAADRDAISTYAGCLAHP